MYQQKCISLQNSLKSHAWPCQNVYDALSFLLDNIFIRFGAKLYKQVVRIPMGTNCAPLVGDLFLFCYERDCMMSLFLMISKLILLTLLSLHPAIWMIFKKNSYLDNMVTQMYHTELQLNKANTCDTAASFF